VFLDLSDRDNKTKKAQGVPGLIVFLRLITSAGTAVVVGDEGREQSRIPKGMLPIPVEIAQKIAQFDIGSHWKTLSDEARLKLFSVAADLRATNQGKSIP
jgi:hypothetical protein